MMIPPRANSIDRACFDYALYGILESDATGQLLQANPAACSITGLRLPALQGLSISELFDPQDETVAQRHFDLVREQGINRTELRLRLRQGRVIELASIDVGGARLLHMFDDVTEQRDLVRALEQARLAAEEANRAKSSFLTNISHEIRTPLNGVIGLAQLALLSDPSPPLGHHLEHILQSSRLLLSLLNDLLDFSKIEGGHVEFERLPFWIDDLVDDLRVPLQQTLRGKPVELSFHVAGDVPRQLVGDRLRLWQVLLNLASNAAKFTAQGVVTLSIERVATARAGTCKLAFRVRDSGIGIDAADIERLFQPFVQADVSTTRRFGGTGLGLAIARMLVRGMHGEIAVSSRPGEGSEFTVILPFALPVAGAPLAAHPATAPTTAAAAKLPAAAPALVAGMLNGVTVLVVDDNDINREVIGGLLGYAGCRVLFAENGEQVAPSLAHAPDLVLMDVQMPLLDGLEATRRLRAAGHTLPVIGLSAGVSSDEEAACQAAGMNGFLSKPVDAGVLVAAIQAWLPTSPGGATPVAGIDMDDALPRFLGNVELLHQLVGKFAAQHREVGHELSALLAAGQNQALRERLHAIKGSAALLGARAITETVRVLEDLLEAGRAADMAPLFMTLDSHLNRLGQPQA